MLSHPGASWERKGGNDRKVEMTESLAERRLQIAWWDGPSNAHIKASLFYLSDVDSLQKERQMQDSDKGSGFRMLSFFKLGKTESWKTEANDL